MAKTTSPSSDRRKATDHDIVMRVVSYCGVCAGLLSGSLALCLCFSVIYSTITGHDVPGGVFTALVPSVTGALGTSIGYLGGLLTNAFRTTPPGASPPTGAEIGKGVVDAAQDAEGLPVKPAEPGEHSDESGG